jgi:hypothetical protein
MGRTPGELEEKIDAAHTHPALEYSDACEANPEVICGGERREWTPSTGSEANQLEGLGVMLPPALIFGEEGDDACQFLIELLKNGWDIFQTCGWP